LFKDYPVDRASNDIITLEPAQMKMTRPISTVKHSRQELQVLSRLKATVSSASSGDVLAKAVQILRDSSSSYNWVGIYLVKGKDLVLSAYVGDAETEHTRIPVGQGICGLAAKEAETIIVPDVNKDPRYLMCFPSTRSEIVVPIVGVGGVLGEIDIDSDRLSAFTEQDREMLEEAAEIMADHLDRQNLRFGHSGTVR
jgi:GAF domain-containing protein